MVPVGSVRLGPRRVRRRRARLQKTVRRQRDCGAQRAVRRRHDVGGRCLRACSRVEATGVSTAPIRSAAEKFVGALTDEQRRKTIFDVDDPEWRDWVNVDNGIYVSQGTSFKEMSEAQREAAFELLRAVSEREGLAAEPRHHEDRTTRCANSTTTTSLRRAGISSR